jgi:Flp pilus assembly protein TadG
MFRFRRNRRSERGVATVEFAVCLPVILAIVMGTLECTTMIFVQQSLQVVAYEAVRTAIEADSGSADVRRRADQVMSERRLNAGVVTFSPSDIDSVAPGTPITVTVEVPADRNSFMNLRFFRNTLRSAATMNKE